MSGKLVTAPQAADRIGVSADTVRRWIGAGHLKARRTPGGHYQIAELELERFLEQMDRAS